MSTTPTNGHHEHVPDVTPEQVLGSGVLGPSPSINANWDKPKTVNGLNLSKLETQGSPMATPTSEDELDRIIGTNIAVDLRELTNGEEATVYLKDLKAALSAHIQRKCDEVELKILQRLENMGEAEAKKQGMGVHNMDGYHRAYGEILAHNIHSRIWQLTPPPSKEASDHE